MLYYLLVLFTFGTLSKHSKIHNGHRAISWAIKEIFNWCLDDQKAFRSIYKQKKEKTKV